MKKFGPLEGVPRYPIPPWANQPRIRDPSWGPFLQEVGVWRLSLDVLNGDDDFPTVTGFRIFRHALNNNHQHKFCWVNLKMMTTFLFGWKNCQGRAVILSGERLLKKARVF